MANLMAFFTYLLLNDQDDWGKQLMITAKARIRAWKSRSHRMSVATFRFIAKRNALTHGVIARQSKQDVRCSRSVFISAARCLDRRRVYDEAGHAKRDYTFKRSEPLPACDDAF
jgi:hypothetical protein